MCSWHSTERTDTTIDLFVHRQAGNTAAAYSETYGGIANAKELHFVVSAAVVSDASPVR